MITPLISLSILAFLFYILFIKGWAWPIFMLGICILSAPIIENYFPLTKTEAIKLTAFHLNTSIHFSIIINIVIFILTISFILNNKD